MASAVASEHAVGTGQFEHRHAGGGFVTRRAGRDEMASSAHLMQERDVLGDSWSSKTADPSTSARRGIVQHIPAIVLMGDQRLCACPGARHTHRLARAASVPSTLFDPPRGRVGRI